VYELKNGLKSSNQKPSCLCLNHTQTSLFIPKLNTLSFFKSSKKFKFANTVVKYIIVFYQATFAHFLGGRCRYYPSCSHYSFEAFENFSFFQASKLVLIRLASCHPLSRKPHYDPVPSPLQEMSMT